MIDESGAARSGVTIGEVPVVRKDIRKQIGKSFGDMVHVTFYEREGK